MDVPPRDLDAAYRRYRPLLLGALAYLARRGLVAPFGDGLDLVHDFFLDEYGGLVERHDADRSAFTTYLFAAFVRYARPRILRMRRWRAAMPGANEPGGLDVPIAEVGLDGVAVGRALASLPDDDRQLLGWRFGDGLSERQIATRRATTRYATRQALLHALGRLVVELGDRSLVDERTLAVARALWSEDRDLADAAGRLQLTVEQVRRISEGLLAKLSRGLGAVREE